MIHSSMTRADRQAMDVFIQSQLRDLAATMIMPYFGQAQADRSDTTHVGAMANAKSTKSIDHDTEVELERRLLAQYPEATVIGEEATSDWIDAQIRADLQPADKEEFKALKKDHLWDYEGRYFTAQGAPGGLMFTLDPVDGTDNFTKALAGQFGMMVSVAHEDCFQAAWIYLPNRPYGDKPDTMVYLDVVDGIRVNGEKMTEIVASPQASETTLVYSNKQRQRVAAVEELVGVDRQGFARIVPCTCFAGETVTAITNRDPQFGIAHVSSFRNPWDLGPVSVAMLAMRTIDPSYGVLWSDNGTAQMPENHVDNIFRGVGARASAANPIVGGEMVAILRNLFPAPLRNTPPTPRLSTPAQGN